MTRALPGHLLPSHVLSSHVLPGKIAPGQIRTGQIGTGHRLAEHGSGRVARSDANAHGGSPRGQRADAELVTADRLAVLTAYGRAWACPDEAGIRAQLTRCCTASSTHVNPFTDPVSGFDGLANLILDFPAMFPGAAFRLTSVPDLHHDLARFAWRLESSARIRILGRDFGYSVEGRDFVEFDRDNRIRRVAVFFGPLIDAVPGR